VSVFGLGFGLVCVGFWWCPVLFWVGWFVSLGVAAEGLGPCCLVRRGVGFVGVLFARADWFLGACLLLFGVVVFWCRQVRRYERGS
jgi:hypothetical protein